MKIAKQLLSAVCATAVLAGTGPAMAADHDKGDIKLAYVEWSSEVASTNVVKALLEEQGYDVTITPVSAAAMWQSVAVADYDGFTAAWLPSTHEDYLAKTKDDIVDLGANLEGTKLGLVVPDYVDVDSIEDLKDSDVAGEFNRRITGIDPGAGLMRLTEKAVDEYGLRRMRLIEGSGATMTAALASAIKAHEPIVVTGWTPHWMFARWDLKYLDDPKNVYGDAEEIHTIVRKGLKDDMPEAYRILDNFYWTPEEMAEVMVMNQVDGSDPYENAQKWLADHPERVKEWLAE
ncbi:glycine/betaine ABC transporter substrate-binding protein [Terasakiispira papahanaumokuakeensis]|uniref:Glycine/betaine ABC transporter substrate-binding protein n=1 Tax=Terasakiispira papahanaumokuakeensis TaxID=197479 RepID=A0A1E2V8S4_9GAMM|nr:glycine betaine ABC transporter substrate-binding protein [Terasakiispira papahanaumokuakeensis]ODC03408.1 glycine/betaine ABC transporter substrate-binding protein [Terasakiispira papahanaumokuakeensis]